MSDPQYDLKAWLRRKLDEPWGIKTQFAEAIGLSGDKVSRMIELENPDPKKRRSIKPHEIQKIAAFFSELPPGYEDMSSWLAKRPPLIASFDEAEQPPEEIDPDWDGNGAGHFDGRIQFEGKIDGSSPEFSAKPGMGPGQTDDRTARVVSNGIATGHPVVNEWYIPPAYIRNALDATPSQIMIVPVIGHSMEPILKSNDRVMVDVSQNAWIGDAVYIIDDGDGVLQAKTLKKVKASSPPRFQIVSEATPDAAPEILRHDQFRIVGRVVGRFTRM